MIAWFKDVQSPGPFTPSPPQMIFKNLNFYSTPFAPNEKSLDALGLVSSKTGYMFFKKNLVFLGNLGTGLTYTKNNFKKSIERNWSCLWKKMV